MGVVIEMGTRKPLKPEPQPTAMQKGPELECLRCHAGFFRLSALGEVNCADCGALMNNLKLAFVPQAPTKGGPRAA